MNPRRARIIFNKTKCGVIMKNKNLILILLWIGGIVGMSINMSASSIRSSSKEKYKKWNDIHCMAYAIFKEAGGEPLRGQLAVADVIMNRIHSGVGNSACEVISQHKGNHYQFGFYRFNKSFIPPQRQKHFYMLANQVLNNQKIYVIPDNILYFNNIPFKSSKYKFYTKIGHQYFYYR